MQDLKRLVRIIADEGSKVLPVVDPTDYTSLEGRLYQFIRNHDELTDEEVCLHLYGEKRLTPSYRMLKSRLRKKLLNSIAFIELSEKHTRIGHVKYIEASFLIHQANKLFWLGEPLLAEKIADQSIAIAQKIELYDVLFKAYEIKQQAELAISNRSKFEYSSRMLQHYARMHAFECEAIIVFNKLKFEVSTGVSNTRKQGADYKELLLKLKDIWQTTGSSRIHSFYHIAHIGYCEVLGDYENILIAIKEAEDLLVSGSINKVWFNENFNNYIKVYSCLRLGKLEEGLQYSSLCLDKLKEGTPNWFAFLENYLLLSLHKNDHNLTRQLCALAVEKGVLKSSIFSSKEKWTLYLRYVKLLLPQEQIVEAAIPDLGKYEISLLSKDKEGFNLPLLIVEYLEMMPKLDAEDMELYASRFRKYSSKYLKGEVWDRARLFLKLLILSMKEEGERLEKKATPLLQKLKSTPPPRDPVAEVEIIPYEHLWELVLERLQQRVNK
ncbi:hypothetical protein [Pontibacter cellulosilyticus]|uniref:Uncharacterized protein n=1 Tax=Pontibacter cellulosilyticus TaxID=1720253 RepID=A0A923SK01_9BACT|nr:hypothetical protein [Pontibacter cellulosilyticus]MBC5994358.1 hypothetical protein [Pontibacter cellulosilyticus]